MNIKLPSIEYFDIVVDDYIKTELDDELIVYFESVNKIVVMNATTTCIWEFIINSICDQTKVCITAKDIVNCIKIKFNKDLPNDNCIVDDIVEIIRMFFDNGLLLCKEIN